MERKYLVTGLAVLGLAFAMPASATQKGVNACTKGLSDTAIKTTKSVAAVFTKCAKAVEGCLAKDTADQPACLTGVAAAGKACDPATLDLNNADGKAGKPLSKAMIGIDKKCNPATIADPEKLTLGTGAILNDPNDATNTLLDINVASLGRHVDGDQFANPSAATYASWAAAVRQIIINNIFTVVQDKHPRVWWLLRLAGVPLNRLENLVLGTHHVTAATNATLVTAGGPVSLLGITANYDLDIGAVNSTTGIASLTIPSATTVFSSVFIPIAGGITVCVDSDKDGSGQLCCGATCPTMGPLNYQVNQDHDSSGNNVALMLLPGEVTPADPSCTGFSVNTIAGGTDVNTACLEDKARSGGCNADILGANNPQAHAPRCLGGARNGKFCDPAAAAADCVGGAGCIGAFTSCCPQSPAVGPMLAVACNGPATVVSPSGTGTNGDMLIGATIAFTLHSHTLDGINYGAGNMIGDSKPDGWGADGIACTDDDTTTPGDPSTLAQTIGTTSAKVFDSNLIPSAFGMNVTSGNYTGAKPSDACHRLSASVTSGYTMVATFPALHNAQLGDTATGVRQVF